MTGHFSWGPVVNTLPSNAGGAVSIPGQGTEITHALWPKNQNVRQKQYCNNFNKDLKINEKCVRIIDQFAG